MEDVTSGDTGAAEELMPEANSPAEQVVGEAEVHQSAIMSLAADRAEVSTSAVCLLKAGDAEITTSAVGAMSVSGDVEFSSSALGAVLAAGDIHLSKAGGSVLLAGKDIHIEQGGGSTLVAGRDMKIKQGGGMILVANHAKVEHGFIAVLAARDAEISEDSRILMDTRSAMMFGAALGTVLVVAMTLIFGWVWGGVGRWGDKEE
jgi:hypothetical protein